MDGWGLADALRALRAELSASQTDGSGETLQFAVGKVVLKLQAVLAGTADGRLGWKIVEVGSPTQSESTQTITLTLHPGVRRDWSATVASNLQARDGGSERSGDDYGSSPLITGDLLESIDGARAASQTSPRYDLDSADSGWINYRVEDHVRGEAFERGRWYTLAVDAGSREDPSAFGSTLVGDLLPDDADNVDLSVQAFAWGAEIDPGPRVLPIRRGEERSKTVRLDFRAVQDRCELNVVISRDRSVCLTATIRIECGRPGTYPEITFSRRPWSAIAHTPARDVGLVISTDGNAIRCVYSDEEFQDSGLLGLNPDGLEKACRPLFDGVDQLMKTVSTDPALSLGAVQGASAVSLFDLPPGTIGEATADAAKRHRNEMAKAGKLLFDDLFLAGDEAAQRIGERLRTVASQSRSLRIQVLTKTDFHIPWGLLYLDRRLPKDSPGKWEMFLGARHLIEVLADPLLDQSDRAYPSSSTFTFSFSGYASTATDEVSVAAEEQRQHLMTLAGGALTDARVEDRPGVKGALAALGGKRPGDLVYLFCHGEARGPEEIGGQGGANLRFGPTKADILTVADLRTAATSTQYARSAPLIVINACQIGRRSPVDQQDLVSYLLNRRARGVIAATAYVPTAFGASWGVGFFDRLLSGAEIGPTLLELSEAALRAWGVPLGLLYTATCPLETRIAAELVAEPAQAAARTL